MKKKLAIILSIVLSFSMISTASVFGASKMSVSPKSMTLAVGDIAQLTVSNTSGKLTWTSSDEEIATVTKKGVVQGKSSGTATITVKSSKKQKASCKVTIVKYAVDSKDTTSLFEAIKDKVAELIKSLTYTKSEIDAKITSGSSGVNYDSKIPTSGNVPLRSGQATSFKSGQYTCVITSFSATKELFNKSYTDENGIEYFYPYKYHIKIEGTTDGNYLLGNIHLMNEFGADDSYEINSATHFRNPIIIDNGTFVYEADHYSNVNATEIVVNHIGSIE